MLSIMSTEMELINNASLRKLYLLIFTDSYDRRDMGDHVDHMPLRVNAVVRPLAGVKGTVAKLPDKGDAAQIGEQF